jgi:hypothetical protein
MALQLLFVMHDLLVERLAFTKAEIGLHVSRRIVQRSVHWVEKRVQAINIIEDTRISQFVEAKLAGSLKTAKPV